MSRRTRTDLTESAPAPHGGRVDRAARVIRGVKVIGLHSKNISPGLKGKRRYTRQCLESALPLYEGAQVFVHHGKRAGAPRRADEPAAGWLEGCRYERDGVYADLHLLASHPLCEHLLEAAGRNPRLWCLSQNAHGATRRDANGEVVEEILEVHSVDLVRRGGTTTSLFEGVGMKLSDFIAGLRLRDDRRKAVQALLEEDGPMDGDMSMPDDVAPPAEDAPGEDHEEALRAGFEASATAIVRDCLAGSMDCAEGMKKLGMLLKAHAKLSDGGGSKPVEESDGGDADDADEGGEPAEKKSPVEESLRSRIAELEAREGVRALCEELGVKASPTLLTAAARLPEGERRALLEEFSGRAPAPTPESRKPRTHKPGGTGPTAVETNPFAALLRGTKN